jgi:hypothetical protein
MKARIVIGTDGQIAFFVDEGSFSEGSQVLSDLLRDLAAGGLQFSEIGQVEQHRHDEQRATNHIRTEH